MKKVSIVTTLLLVLAMAMGLAACSSYGAVKKAFEKEGYAESKTVEDLSKNFIDALGKEDFAVNTHAMSKVDGLVVKAALIIEFKATEDMKKFYDDNKIVRDAVENVTSDENAKNFQKNLENAGFAKGNCLVIPLTHHVSEITAIVKKA